MTEITEKDRDRWSRERIAEQRSATQEAISRNRLRFQRDQSAKKAADQKNKEAQKRSLALATLESSIRSEREITERSVKLEELQQAFYERKLQLDYEYEAKYRDLNFQEYRLQTSEDIRREKALIVAKSDANIAEYKAQLAGEITKMQLQGKIARDQIREELKATLLTIKANLEAELVRKKQEQKHELHLLRAKHEYDMEMEILRDELRRQAHEFNSMEIATMLKKMENHM